MALFNKRMGQKTGMNPLTSAASIAAIREGAFQAVSLVSGVPVNIPLISRLRVSGSGALSIDSIDAAGAVTAGAFAETYSNAVDNIEFPYYGESAVQIRATFPATLTVEVL